MPTAHTTSDQPRTLLTVERAARQLSVGRTTMFQLIKTGAIESVRIGRSRRVPAEAIDTYIQQLSSQHAA